MTASETADGLCAAGNAHYAAGLLTDAADCYRRALSIDPSVAAAHYNLGCVLIALAGPREALPLFLEAAARSPGSARARAGLGLALAGSGRMAEATAQLEAARDLNPGDAGIRNNLGLALSALGRGEEAHASFLEAIRLDPSYPEAHSNLGILFERYGRTSEAISSCLEALRLRPGFPEALSHLANALKSQGRHAEALAQLEEALRLKPDFVEGLSSLLFTLCYPADIAPGEIFARHRAFGAAHRFPFPCFSPDPDPRRVLRIGYVSADFREHAVARFIEPVLREHDRNRFEIFCYANLPVPDGTSARLGALCGRFANIAGVPDQEASELIRRDRIDILVDLSGHTADNRLLLFARKPAPLQVTWLGYPGTTGLDAMDYRITDAVADPPGVSEQFHVERLLRLPGSFCCFAPPEEAPGVSELPALGRGAITFGSFNNPAKITPETVALWAGALLAVPGSRLLIKGYSLADRGSRERFIRLFAEEGVEPGRLDLRGNTPSYREHLELYGLVDIALDSYPYNGTTTSCEALWMGVPVVTLAGETHRSRVGASLLKSVGLERLVALSPQGFALLAASLARDPRELAALRDGLRGRMAASPLTDAAGFTRDLERAFLTVWKSFLTGEDAAGAPPSGQKGGELACAALPEIEQALNGQMALDLTRALKEDQVRLGLAASPPAQEGIPSSDLVQTAALLLNRGMVTPADLILRYALDRGYRSAHLSETLGEIALSLGAFEMAALHFREAAARGRSRLARIKLVKAEHAAACSTPPDQGKRFLLIKAWGYGFWSDVNHLLGQCLLAEMTGRTPVVAWGGNSLFSDDPLANAFERFFEPVGSTTQAELATARHRYYPDKWHAGNLGSDEVNKSSGPGSRCSALYTLGRGESVVVSDFHYAVHDLVPWIAPGHPLYGLSTDQIYRYLFQRYLRVQPAILRRVSEFFRSHLEGKSLLAVHVRGGDKGGEDPNLSLLNSLYPAEIERYLSEAPGGGLFISTDDEEILSGFKRRYPGRVIHTAATRTETKAGVHYLGGVSRYRLGEEVLVDALLAARCERFLGNGLSNVSCAVAQMKQWPAGSCRLLGGRLDRLRQFTLYRS